MSGFAGEVQEAIVFRRYNEFDPVLSRVPHSSVTAAFPRGTALAEGAPLADGTPTYKLCGPTDECIGFADVAYLGAGGVNGKMEFMDPTPLRKLPVEGGRPMAIVRAQSVMAESTAVQTTGGRTLQNSDAVGVDVTFEGGKIAKWTTGDKVWGRITANALPTFTGGGVFGLVVTKAGY